MCLVAVGWRATPRYAAVIAANRDEFHARPTRPAHWWPDTCVLGGIDELAGGSWLAVDGRGRFAALTNVRQGLDASRRGRSRGLLVRDFMMGDRETTHYAAAAFRDRDAFSPFNLLVGDARAFCYVGERSSSQDGLDAGIYVLSNAALNTPWPKAERLRRAMAAAVEGDDPIPPLFEALADRRPATDSELPATGMDRHVERLLSSPFIHAPEYGTRSSTVVVIDAAGNARFCERRFDADGRVVGTEEYEFKISDDYG